MEGISYIITTYNRPGLLLKAIDSVIAECVSPAELLIIDDHGDEEICLPDYARRHFGGDIHVFRNAENKGVIETRNVGLAAAKYDFIIFLDDDDISFPNRSKDLLPYIKGSDYAFVAGKCEMWVGQNRFIIPKRAAGLLSPPLLLATLPHINGVIWQKSKLISLGGLDNRVPHLGEHVSMQQLLLRGEKALLVDEVVARFKSVEAGLTANVILTNQMKPLFVAFHHVLSQESRGSAHHRYYADISARLPLQKMSTVDDYLDFVAAVNDANVFAGLEKPDRH